LHWVGLNFKHWDLSPSHGQEYAKCEHEGSCIMKNFGPVSASQMGKCEVDPGLEFRYIISCKLMVSKDIVSLNKNAQLSMTNPRDAKPCGKVLQFDV